MTLFVIMKAEALVRKCSSLKEAVEICTAFKFKPTDDYYIVEMYVDSRYLVREHYYSVTGQKKPIQSNMYYTQKR